MRGYHGEEGDGPRCMVVDGHKVNEEHSATDESREECSTAHHLLDPVHACSVHTVRVHVHVYKGARGMYICMYMYMYSVHIHVHVHIHVGRYIHVQCTVHVLYKHMYNEHVQDSKH